jgi:hypothetical protein
MQLSEIQRVDRIGPPEIETVLIIFNTFFCLKGSPTFCLGKTTRASYFSFQFSLAVSLVLTLGQWVKKRL